MTAAKGAYSGTLITLNGCSIYEVKMTLKVTFDPGISTYLYSTYKT